MTDWKDALDNFDLTTSDGLEAVKRLFVEQNRKQQIEGLKQEDNPLRFSTPLGQSRNITILSVYLNALNRYWRKHPPSMKSNRIRSSFSLIAGCLQTA